MKIFFLIRSLGFGGAERQLVELTKELYKNGHKVQVITFYITEGYYEELQNYGIEIKSLNKKSRWDLVFIHRLAKYLLKNKPDVLHSYLGTSNILVALLKLLIPNTLIVWGVRSSNMDLSNYGWLSRVLYYIECRLSKYADLIIANSYSGKAYAAMNGFPINKIEVIPNGIDVSKFKPNHLARQRLRNDWNIEDEEILIGNIARLDPMKDHITFFKAAKLLMENRKNVRFVCVGDGDEKYKQYLKNQACLLDIEKNILWVGNRSDMPNVYNAIDVLCSSSYTEGFSNVIGEAMSCGVPCVVTNAGDSSIIVGETGIVVDVGDVNGLVQGIEDLIEQDFSMKNAVRERIMNRFSREQLGMETEKKLVSLVLARKNNA